MKCWEKHDTPPNIHYSSQLVPWTCDQQSVLKYYIWVPAISCHNEQDEAIKEMEENHIKRTATFA